MEQNREYTHTHTYDEVLKAIMKLPDDEKNTILGNFDIEIITRSLDSNKNFEYAINVCQVTSMRWALLNSALLKLYDLLNNPESATDEMLSDYDKLDVSQKKETALKLLNNGEFQRDCCDILICDMERNVANDPTLKALDNLLGITKYLRRCLKLGIGADHQYMIE